MTVSESGGRAEGVRRPRLSRALRVALLALIVTRVPLVIEAFVLHHHAPSVVREGHFLLHGGEVHPHWLVDAFQKWDSYWFLNIAREGYRYYGPMEQIHGVRAGQPETNVTPFPLYPMLMRAGQEVVGSAAVAGLVLSQVFLLLGLYWLYRLVAHDGDGSRAELATWLFALVPWTYAFSAIYSESLFFACTVGAVLALRRDRYLVAGGLGMAAALTRLPGVLVVIPLVWEHVVRHGVRLRGGGWRVVLLALVPLGTAAYFGYLWWLTGEPMAYFIAQRGWHKEMVAPWHHPLSWLTADGLSAEQVLDLVVFIFVAGTLAVGFRRVRWSYWVYGLVGFLMLMSSSYLLGLPRYAAGLFPLYLIWADLGVRWPAVGRALVIVFAMLAPVVFWVWTSWYYAF
jgi:hypothetical protein